jgi:hypothetical protein
VCGRQDGGRQRQASARSIQRCAKAGQALWVRQQLPVRPHHLISSVVVDAEGTVSWQQSRVWRRWALQPAPNRLILLQPAPLVLGSWARPVGTHALFRPPLRRQARFLLLQILAVFSFATFLFASKLQIRQRTTCTQRGAFS